MAVHYKEYYLIVRHVDHPQCYLDILNTAPDKTTAETMAKESGYEAVHHTEFKNLTRWYA